MDIIFAYRKKWDSEFAMFVIEEEDEIPRMQIMEVQNIVDLFELAPRELWTYLVDTSHEALIDLEDEARDGNNNLVIKKYYKHTCDWCHYVEYDSRILDLEGVHFNL